MRFIGSKASLLENIQKVIDENVTDNSEVFCDIFAGTGVMAQRAIAKMESVIINDFLYSNEII